jgi:hypothetical protein
MTAMNPLDKLRVALKPKPKEIMHTSHALESHQGRIDTIADIVTNLTAEQQSIAVRRQTADELVRKLSNMAATGKLKDATRLTEALRVQRELTAPNGLAERLQAAQQERADLEQRGHKLRREAAQTAYSNAVVAYAKAVGVAGLPAMADEIRKLAPDAGASMSRCSKCGHDGMHTSSVAIGGAVVEVLRRA